MQIQKHECAMDILKGAVDKLTPLAAVQDGMGPEDKNDQHKRKDKEPIAAIAPLSGR